MGSRKWKAKGGNVKGRKSRAAQRKERVYFLTFNATENHVHYVSGDIWKRHTTDPDKNMNPRQTFHPDDTRSPEFHHRGHGDQATSVNAHYWIGCIVSQLSRAENFWKTHPIG